MSGCISRFDGVRCEAQDPDAPGAAKEARESKDAARFRQKATKKLFGEVEAEGIAEWTFDPFGGSSECE